MDRLIPEKHHRASLRLRDHDYAKIGAYFLTLCTWRRACLFGQIREGRVRLNTAGRVVESCWRQVPTHFANVALDAFIVMPNHLHAVVRILRATRGLPLHKVQPIGPAPGSIGALVGTFKSTASTRINQLSINPNAPVWQRNFYDRVIRNEAELARIREYIAVNPFRWEDDPENPAKLGRKQWKTSPDPVHRKRCRWNTPLEARHPPSRQVGDPWVAPTHRSGSHS